MKMLTALKMVLELAEQNVINDSEYEEEMKNQEEACNKIHKLIKIYPNLLNGLGDNLED